MISAHRPDPVVASRLAAVLVLAGSLGVIVECAARALQDLRYTRAATEVSFWGRDDYRPARAVVLRTVAEIDNLREARPAHPDFLALAASAAAWRAYFSLDRRAAHHYFGAALAHQRSALASRPAWRHGWAQLDRYARLSGQQIIVTEAARHREYPGGLSSSQREAHVD